MIGFIGLGENGVLKQVQGIYPYAGWLNQFKNCFNKKGYCGKNS